jgi:hypothetical protein
LILDVKDQDHQELELFDSFKEISVQVSKTKFQLILTKTDPTKSWASLERKESESQPLTYPSSSKRSIKNWDNIDSEEVEEKKETDIERYFQDLYANSTEDVKKAMMKSFVNYHNFICFVE